ncbi:TIGR04219 family outer membrane beta-barrel protein [Reinekea sp.]|jgi:outer membrane protein|uniref:TIGR04219 family outer membrane beta-barrel protein n=1 Tax=Reinekea sp. TaxID=1970455 RepID=UPI002A830184|nr:TIGR04219 family outer membrane beta-barrel protein [Reinekea sp.]
MNKWIVSAVMVLAVPAASAKVLMSIDAGAGYNLNSLADDSTFIDGTFDLAGDQSAASSPYGLGMEAQNGFYGWAKISLPLLPDVKLKFENLVLDGSNTVTFSESILGETFATNGKVDSSLDLTHVDLGLTIGLPIPVVDIDLGVNFRALLGGFSATGVINGTQQTKEVLFPSATIIPMAYVSAAATIPGVGVKLGGELSTLPLGDSNITDWNIKGTWFAPLPTSMLVKVGVEAGYRRFNMTIADKVAWLDTSDFQSNVTVGGFFVGAALHF